jgi:Ca2+-binding EF-hand superfamily protein
VVKREESLLVNEKSRRTWMKRSGKKLDFTDSELKKMRHYFNQLDTNKMGYIGCKELL